MNTGRWRCRLCPTRGKHGIPEWQEHHNRVHARAPWGTSAAILDRRPSPDYDDRQIAGHVVTQPRLGFTP